MSSPHPPSTPLPDPGRVVLFSTEAAAVAAVQVVGRDPHTVAALTVDADRRATGAVRMHCPTHHDHELDVLEATAGSPLVVLASGRARLEVPPAADTWWQWDRLLERAEALGTVLLDWFLIGPGLVVSMAEMDGVPESRWWPLDAGPPGPAGPPHRQRRRLP